MSHSIVAWFPKILAGPIDRTTNFLPQVSAGLRADPERLVLGLQLIGWGLIKKVVIADNLAPMVDKTFGIAAFASPIDLLISVYFFAFQIYCDFSGYTDIAIGVSLLFGLQLMENFRRPYLAQQHGRVLGRALAHIAGPLVPRLPIHSTGRRSRRAGAPVSEPDARVYR